MNPAVQTGAPHGPASSELEEIRRMVAGGAHLTGALLRRFAGGAS